MKKQKGANNLHDESAHFLAAGIRLNPSLALEELHLENNFITDIVILTPIQIIQ